MKTVNRELLTLNNYQLFTTMHPEIETLLVQAENRFLKADELTAFKRYVATLTHRLKTYEFLRDQEIAIFQSVADQLQAAFPDAKQEVLERSLKHWLLALRHCAMAMLLNDPVFLEERLLSWLSGLVQAYQSQDLETKTYQLLQTRLKELLSEQALALVQPFLEQAQEMLSKNEA